MKLDLFNDMFLIVNNEKMISVLVTQDEILSHDYVYEVNND